MKGENKMKRLIVLIGLMLMFCAIQAQTVEKTLYMDKGQTYLRYTPDFTLAATTAKAIDIVSFQDWPTAQILTIALDTGTVAGNHTNVAIQLQGKVSSLQAAYSNIGSAINWKVSTKDTVIVYSETTENRYNYYRVLMTGTGGAPRTSRVTEVQFKLFYPD